MQKYWNLDVNENGDSLPGPLIIGTFEKQAPNPWVSLTKWCQNVSYTAIQSRKAVG